jgi:hypothetical protein
MKNRKNILTYIVAAVVTLVVSASSSWGTQPLQGPENYTGKLTHGEFVSCEGQILNPPARRRTSSMAHGFFTSRE